MWQNCSITLLLLLSDFAARSCLVTGANTVKVGDYGTSREIFKVLVPYITYAITPFIKYSSPLPTGGLLCKEKGPQGMAGEMDGSGDDCGSRRQRTGFNASLPSC